jgi:glutamine synthetase
VNTEALLVHDIAKSMILPAAYRYQGELAATAAAVKAAGVKSVDISSLEKVSALVLELEAGIVGLEHALAHKSSGSTLDHAKHYRDAVIPAMLTIRKVVDQLELIIADDLWPLPTYQEMLFIR